MSPLLEARGIAKTFPMGETEIEVLHGIDLEIEEGEWVAIMGASGSGKTTCLEILGAISRPTRGRYHLDGRPVHALGDDALADLRASSIGFVFQTFNLVSTMSALRNAALPLLYAGVERKTRERRAAELLHRVGLGARVHHRPLQMSGGERQRVALARALANRPRVIFADEPTGNLDEATGREILALFQELHAEGRTLVVVTHSEEVASRAGRIVRIRDGTIERDERRGAA